MTRRHFGAILFAAIVGLMTFFVSTSTAQAQNQKCCTYTVVVKGIPDACFPFKVWTEWSTGSDIFVVEKDGVYIRKVPAPCPPEPDFKGVTLDGVTYVGIDEKAEFYIGKCCYLVSVTLDNNSCVEITITPC